MPRKSRKTQKNSIVITEIPPPTKSCDISEQTRASIESELRLEFEKRENTLRKILERKYSNKYAKKNERRQGRSLI